MSLLLIWSWDMRGGAVLKEIMCEEQMIDILLIAQLLDAVYCAGCWGYDERMTQTHPPE